MRPQSYYVWAWEDAENNAAFVGWGKHQHAHPAKTVWAQRKAYNSDLNRWLCTLRKEPDRNPDVPSIAFHKADASAVASQLRDRYRQNGVDVISSRPIGTHAGGGGSRAVMSPEFEVFESVRAAAREMGVNPSSVTRWCQSENSDWCFFG